jgi:oligopeptide transport system substrate-binding protein
MGGLAKLYRGCLCLAGSLLVATACRAPVDQPVIVTKIVMIEGEEIVVTRVIQQTIEIPVTVTPPASQREPVTLDISFGGDITTLDPQQNLNQNDLDLIESLFVGLTNHNHINNQIEPELATEWEVSSDGRTWTFHLRPDIYWVQFDKDGDVWPEVEPLRPVSADDVVYGIRRACHPSRRAPDVVVLFIIEGCEALNGMGEASRQDMEMVGVTAPDDETVTIRLARPASHFLTITALAPLRPAPAQEIDELGEEWTEPGNIVTSGPFVLNNRSLEGAQVLLHRNPYWPIPFSGNVDVVNILQLDDEMDAYRLWEDRNLDLSPVPATEQTSIINANPQKLQLVPRQELFYLAFNFNSPVFREPEVRRAFAAALDREQLIREVYDGRGIPVRHFAPAGVIAAPPIDEVGMGNSADYARQQMAISGFNDCRLMPPIRFLVSSSDTSLHQAQLMRDMWMQELGCAEDQIIIEQVQFGTLLASTRRDAGAARPDMWELGWASYYPDENNWLGDLLHCQDSENRQDRPCSEADDLIRQAGIATTGSQRAALYRQVEGMFFGEGGIVPLVPLFARADYILRQPWLAYTPALFGGEQYDTYSVDPVVKELEQNR